MTQGRGNGFIDGNNRRVSAGDEVEYRFGTRRGKLIHVAHDGEADVEFFDTGKTEVVKWHHLCGVPPEYRTTQCDPAACLNGKCRATGECVERIRPNVEKWLDDPAVQVALERRPMTGLWHGLTAEQQKAAMEYDGPETQGPVHDDDVNPKTIMGARRVDISLLPAAGIIHGAHAMMDGAAKYNPYNWREKKVPARTYISAAMRHLMDYLDGEENATDSGVHHLGHVIGCCAIVLDAMETDKLIDDRPTKGAAAAILARLEGVLKARAA